MTVKLNDKFLKSFVSEEEIKEISQIYTAGKVKSFF